MDSDLNIHVAAAALINPFLSEQDPLKILLCLMPDDSSHHRETPWAVRG